MWYNDSCGKAWKCITNTKNNKKRIHFPLRQTKIIRTQISVTDNCSVKALFLRWNSTSFQVQNDLFIMLPNAVSPKEGFRSSVRNVNLPLHLPSVPIISLVSGLLPYNLRQRLTPTARLSQLADAQQHFTSTTVGKYQYRHITTTVLSKHITLLSLCL